jgi:hypothetical protein
MPINFKYSLDPENLRVEPHSLLSPTAQHPTPKRLPILPELEPLKKEPKPSSSASQEYIPGELPMLWR